MKQRHSIHFWLVLTTAAMVMACGDGGTQGSDTFTPDALTDTNVGPDTTAKTDREPSEVTGDTGDDTEPGDVSVPDVEAGNAKACPIGDAPPIAEVEPLVPDVCEEQPLGTIPDVLEAEVNGSGFIYTKPADPKGLMLVFHGGGGDMYEAVSRIEASIFLNDAAKKGFAVASLNSEAHITAPEGPKFKWNTDKTACNPDVVNVSAMVERLMDPEDLAVVPPGTPLFALGVSNGGSMVSRTAQHVNFSAVAIYISNAQQFHDVGATIPPVAIVAGEHDGTVGTEGPCNLYALAGDATFKLNWSDAVTPGLFTRIPGIDCAMSQTLFTAFKENDLLDENSRLKNNPSDLQSWLPFLPAEAESVKVQVRDLLMERFGEHSFTSEFNEEILTFLVDRAVPSKPEDLSVCEE
jgi:hypothetical protein